MQIFDILDRLISRFIWQGRRPRVRLKTLQLPKEVRGLNLPCLKSYFFAAQLKPLVAWVTNDTSTRWLNLEISQCEYALQQLVFSNISLKSCKVSVWSKNTAQTWRDVQKKHKLANPTSSLTLIKSTPDFKPLQLDVRFKQWAKCGLTYIHQLIESNRVKSFSQIKEEFKLPNTDFFRFLQIR